MNAKEETIHRSLFEKEDFARYGDDSFRQAFDQGSEFDLICDKPHPKYGLGGYEDALAYRLLYANMLLPECVEVNPNKRGGIPVIRGTRFTAAQVLAEIADGRSVAELCETFEIDAETVTEFLQALSIYLDRPVQPQAHAQLSARRVPE